MQKVWVVRTMDWEGIWINASFHRTEAGAYKKAPSVAERYEAPTYVTNYILEE